VACTSPCILQWIPGSTHTIAAATQATAGTQYIFGSWSDGGAASHTVTGPSSATTYTATFSTQYFLTTSAAPSAGGSISPASGWYNSGAVVAVSATAAAGYTFSGFSGALAGTATPQNVTMNAAATVTASFTANPVSITVASSPAGLSLTVDNVACTSPCAQQWTPGSTHTIAASTQAGAAGTQYVFASWSDGGTASHTVTGPSSASTYTATFGTQYFLTTSAAPSAGGSISPASGWYNSGAVVAVSATAAAGYTFAGFSGALTGTATPQNVTMNAPATVTANFTPSIPWYNTGGTWSNRKALAINHTQVAGALTNFPVLVSITDLNLQAVAKADGSDIVFTAADGISKLNHEIESYNSATGALVAWVNVPSVSATVDTGLYLYYGNAAATNQQNAAGVWDANYKGVWHLQNAVSSADSTANGNTGSNTSITTAAGEIGSGDSFAGVGRITTGTAGMSFANSTPFTFEGWVKPANVTGRQGVWSRVKDGTHYTILELNGNILRFLIGDGSEYVLSSSVTISSGVWTHVAGVRAPGSMTVYINGVAVGTRTEATTGDFFTGYGAPGIGSGTYDASFSGTMDEVRVSSVNRSAAWITTEYRNENAPGTFLTVGAQEIQAAGSH
jgi:hypothetical protein